MDTSQNDSVNKGIIAWFARNSVAANLLMLFIIVGGLLMATSIRKQMFPQSEINWIQVNVAYPGAAPPEIEEGITIKVEEALKSLQGLERVITYSRRSIFTAYIKVDEAYDPQEVLDEIKQQIDSISSFPEGIERPVIERRKYKQEVLYICLYGDLERHQLKDLGKQIHDEIRALPRVNISELHSGLNYEISIEVSKDKLREYGLRFSDIAQAVKNFSTNMSAGQIRAEDGYISLRVENQAYKGYEFESLPLINLEDGTHIVLSDVATVKDGFEEGIQYAKFNGKNSVTIFVGAAKNQSIPDISKVVNEYVTQKQADLPNGVYLESWVDLTYYLQGRLDMMLNNMKYGGLLVFLILALFLRTRLAFWVMMGLPVSFLGALLFMPMQWVDVTINVTSLFGFILVLGIVVDDAIVIGESINTQIEEKGQTLHNVIRGAQRVAMPATFGVLTTVAAFVPMVLASGPESAFSKSIGFVVIFCLLFSLVESKLILPAHLARMKISQPNPKNPLHRLRGNIDAAFKNFVENSYKPKLKIALHYRYLVISFFIVTLLISIGLFHGGVIRFIGTPKIPHDFPSIKVEMNPSSSEQATLDIALQISDAITRVEKSLEEQYGTGMIENTYVSLESRTSAEIQTKLIEAHLRPIDTFALSEKWREAMPVLPGVKSLSIRDNLFGSERDDGDISFRFLGGNYQQLKQAADALKTKLSTIKGVGDINDSRQYVSKEVQFSLKPLAYSMGLSIADIASQASFGFYGVEAQRILRNGEEIKVMIRYPESQRNSIGQVENILIQAPNGAEVPLSEVAQTQLIDSTNEIRRENSSRSISVWASVNADLVEPQVLAKDIRDNFIPDMLKHYPGVNSTIAGKVQREIESTQAQLRNFILSLVVIFALLAIPLRSYTQPFLIMSVIPFGVIGAMFGHLLLGMDMSALSMFGVIAAAGVVVNDSLVMVDFINNTRAQGATTTEAVIQAGCRRFRAIMLTSLTTFIGLIPIITETSMQAKIVIPMAVSLAFGVLFATVITLLLIPCLFVAAGDFKHIFARIKKTIFGHSVVTTE